jgi:hypothetical protein
MLSREIQWNRRKLSECSNPLKNILLSIVSAWSDIYPTKSDIFIGSQKCGSTARSDISNPRLDISDQSDLSNLHWVPKLWQLPRSNISNPRSDISDPSDLFGLHRVPVPCHPLRPDISEPHRIYLTRS